MKNITPPTRALTNHPGLEDIFLLLCSGWPAMRVAGMVARKYNMPVNPNDIEEYAETIPQGFLLAFDQLVHDFGDMDVIIDVVGEQTAMLALMRDRIQAAQLVEDSAGQPNTHLTSMIKTYFILLERYAKTLSDFGVVSLKETKVAPVRSDNDEETLKDILDGRRAFSEVHPPALHDPGTGRTGLPEPTSNQ